MTQSKERANLVAEHAKVNAGLTQAGASEREKLTKQIGDDKAQLATIVAKEESLTSTIATIVADIADVKAKAATEDRTDLIKKLTAEVKSVKKGLGVDL